MSTNNLNLPLQCEEAAEAVTITNNVLASGVAGTAVDLAVGTIVKRGNVFYRLGDAVAAGKTGTAHSAGRYALKKNTGVAFTQGQSLGWDFTNGRVTTDLSNGVIGFVTDAAASADITVAVNINVHSRRSFTTRKNPSAGEDTANSMDVDCGFPVAGAILLVTLTNSAGLQRVCTVIPKAGAGNENIITISEASLAATDIVNIHVIEGTGA